MKPRLSLAFQVPLLIVFSISASYAVWSGPTEIIKGSWGPGSGQFGLRSEGGLSVVPAIESITPDQRIIISDLVNKKQMVFNGKGALLDELKWDGAKRNEGGAVAPLSQRDRQAAEVHSLKIGVAAYRITVVFPDKNLEVESEEDFRTAARDAAGYVYGVSADMVVRFDKNGKKTGKLRLPNAHEELIQVPGQRAPRGVYVEYGEPVIAPNGDVYVWRKSEAAYSILKWSWQ